jgi:transcriptional regulator with XRE-family HTH domain
MPEIVRSIMKDKGFTIEQLEAKSKIDRRTINHMRKGEIKTKTRIMEYTPKEKTIVAFCITCDLDMLMAITLLESVGLTFKRTSKVHYAYCYLIVNCRGKPIEECNEILRGFEIEEEDLLREKA